MRHAVILTFGLLLLVLPALAAAEARQARAELRDAHGQRIGEATLRQTAQGVLIAATFSNLPAGPHAFHIHETGKCEPPFKSAGDHFNPTGRQHGFEGEKGAHAGDLPNIHVPDGGRLTVEVLARDVSLDGGRNSLLDADGAALVIHAGPDDYRTDPAGGAGDRIACGVIVR